MHAVFKVGEKTIKQLKYSQNVCETGPTFSHKKYS